MSALLLDTHAVIWFLEGGRRLSRSALDEIEGAVMEGSALHVPAISIVEMGYLAEKVARTGC
ncbi:MAG: hypothetical protein HYY93_08075 [Planctomycetes bacterium]|nr:hypothetical protein [Planctomycetota bacterium]